ncbi:MAG TPA: GTP 3',8-cyclase MoaA [Candidatus Binatia bacterium]|nr:GTP 3',8-cyclase MoaA [Candidatus Binatia bacterium]
MLNDVYLQPIRDLRISVTDRCNFRCTYCMPLDEYEWIDKKEILTFEEIARLARLFVGLGVNKIRLTGGEPLVRQDLPLLIEKLSALPGLEDLCLTTNGALLAERVNALKRAGLKRVNVSVDTLDPEKFRRITKRGDLNKVLDGIAAAQRAGLEPIKLNAVVERGVNDEDILPLVQFAREHGLGIRFIEYMDVGNANDWTSAKLVPKKEIIERINSRYPLRERGRQYGSAPAVDYEFIDGRGDIGVIASVTEPFCGSCTRMRLTADGKIVTCLFSQIGHDIKARLRAGSSDEEIAEFIAAIWRGRTDRYSAERLEALKSSTYDPRQHRKIEMISLGG